MKILILGSGGREHAIAWKLSQSSHSPELHIAPGNAGTATLGKNVPISLLDFDAIRQYCLENRIQMVVVGPEEPLVRGIYDYFREDPDLEQIIITGPSKAGAQLEGSKAFSKKFMQRNGIPTAKYAEFTRENFQAGLDYIAHHALPIVLKADGLAAGKGVVICANREEAATAFTQMIRDDKFGTAGHKVVIEEFLEGIELSVFVLTDGNHYLLLPEAKDYKKIGEYDTGLNTGGMGAISPAPFATSNFMGTIRKKIIEPTLHGMRSEGIDYKGFIFFGLIKCDDGPYVIEYNCRLGDPETEIILPRLNNDLVEMLLAMHSGTLGNTEVEINKNVGVTFVAVSGGYPGKYQQGFPISFNYLKNPMSIKHLSEEEGGAIVFHAGTAIQDGDTVTNGGRVLAVSALAGQPGEAVEMAIEILSQIHFEGMYYRSDIGYEFIE